MSSPRQVGAAIAFVLFIGAARADASAAQLERLRAELPPLIDQYRDGGPEYARPLLEHVIEVMGPDWRPDPEWRAWIDKMLADDTTDQGE